jgi:mono/diheme cytochrome c family protein
MPQSCMRTVDLWLNLRAGVHPLAARSWLLAGCLTLAASVAVADERAPLTVRSTTTAEMRRIADRYCFECHGRGSEEGNLALDKLVDDSNRAKRHAAWLAVWKNLRAQSMPPADEPQPKDHERQALIQWIEREVFHLDPANPDPGRVTIRRLNRVEYEYTIHDLLGVDFDAEEAFPADDTGYGFDTIGDVLTISPLLVEKYLEAARAVVAKAVPPEGPGVPRRGVSIGGFRAGKKSKKNAYKVPFADAATLEQTVNIDVAGRYSVRFEVRAAGADEATSNTARVSTVVDHQPLKSQEIGWDNNNTIVLAGEAKLSRGRHALGIELTPLDPPQPGEDRLFLTVRKVELQGPLDGTLREYPSQFRRVFFDGPPPADAEGRREYAAKILRHFADRAFRRPIDDVTLERLVDLALPLDRTPQPTFEQGIADGLTAILVSPRFLLRAELQTQPDNPSKIVPLDELALASRLSYFLWSSLPDDQLFDLARHQRLRAQLAEQVDRMLDDPRSQRFVENFVGQWLQTRDVDGFSIDAKKVLGLPTRDASVRVFNSAVRRALRQETEMLFAHVLRSRASALDLLTADYTFLNEPLAKFYGIEGVDGDKMRQVNLAKDGHRGGILTQASVLLVTSNPTHTSPVKRGLFVLENLLGSPPPPPPANVPPLDVKSVRKGGRPLLRTLLEEHRRDPLCASCHSRMDPIGLAMEEYNALGLWREREFAKPIDTAGRLITGEKFADTRDLERVIATQRRGDFYRCLSEKMLTYAVGRGMEYYDAPTVDKLVASLERDGGRLRTLVHGIVDSAPFQKRRGDGSQQSTAPRSKPAPRAADAAAPKSSPTPVPRSR